MDSSHLIAGVGVALTLVAPISVQAQETSQSANTRDRSPSSETLKGPLDSTETAVFQLNRPLCETVNDLKPTQIDHEQQQIKACDIESLDLAIREQSESPLNATELSQPQKSTTPPLQSRVLDPQPNPKISILPLPAKPLQRITVPKSARSNLNSVQESKMRSASQNPPEAGLEPSEKSHSASGSTHSLSPSVVPPRTRQDFEKIFFQLLQAETPSRKQPAPKASTASPNSEFTEEFDLPIGNRISNPPDQSVQYAGNRDLRLLFPLAETTPISSQFGWRIHPISGELRFHSGTDLSAPIGTPVLAADSGQVVLAEIFGGYGIAVIIQHQNGRYQTLYAHLSERFVQPGDQVQQGDVIGRVGSTGSSTGPHLHFELQIATAQGWTAVNAESELKLKATNVTASFPQQPSAMFIQPVRPSIKLVETFPKSRNSTPIVKVAPRQQQIQPFTQFGSPQTPAHGQAGFGQFAVSAIAFAVLKKPAPSV